MSSKDLAIQATDLSKCYTIYSQPIDRLKQSIFPKVSRVLGKSPKMYYREFWALHDVSLEVGRGETIGIIGRNGSGKSTLLQLICGTLTPTIGKIETKGRITALLELGSGFNPEFSGRENVFLNGAILGLSREEIEARFEDIARFADIGDFIEQPVKFYSSGMTVRLAFAVQAMVDPDILVVDEALAVGDERFQRKCFRRLEELKENGTSILFVSHSSQQIVELCDHALLLEQGQRLLFDDPINVVRAYHRLIYADPADQMSMIQEFKEWDREDAPKQNAPVVVLPEENVPVQTLYKEKKSGIDFYESGMIPQSTEMYPIQGARLESIKIFNSEGKVVNNLLSGREYSFEISGTFLEERETVYLGFHIRSMTSVEITGQIFPHWGKYIDRVHRGQRFKLTHKIKMSLTPNTYFAGGGIWSTTEPVCLHKIVDAIMFRVMPKTENRAFGYVDLAVGEPELKFIKE